MDRTDRNFLIGAGAAVAAAAGIVFLFTDRKKTGEDPSNGYRVLLNCREPLHGDNFFDVSDNAAWDVHRTKIVNEAADAAIKAASDKASATGNLYAAEPVSVRAVATEVWRRLFQECGQPDQEGREDLDKYFQVICNSVGAILKNKYEYGMRGTDGTHMRWDPKEDC